MTRRIFLAAGLVLFAWLVFRLGPGRILGMLLDLGWGFVGIALLYAGHQLLRTAALRRCLPLHVDVKYGELLWIRIAGEAVAYLTFTGPFLAEPTRAWLLKRRGLTAEEGFAATLTEYLVYTLLAAVFSTVALAILYARFPLHGAMRTGVAATIAGMSVFLAVAVLAIVFRVHLIGAALGRLTAIPVLRRRWRLDPVRVSRMEDLLLDVLRDSPLRLLRIVAFDVGAQAVLIVELYWMMKMLTLAFPLVYPILIEAGSKLANTAFFFIPARVGASEGVLAVMFGIVGLPAAAGFTVSFARRLRSLIVAVIGGFALSSLSRDSPAPGV